MVHVPRRRRARATAVLLGALLFAAFSIGRASSLTPAQPAAGGATTTVAGDAGVLEPRVAPVYDLLNDERTHAGLEPLQLDAALAATATRDACAIARGDMPLSGDRRRLREAGGHRENTGLVIDDDPVAGARAMHDWWTSTSVHRRDRMDPEMVRYGIGACNAEDRTYYVERFAP